MEITQEQLDKLPKWAVSYIHQLKSEVNRLKDIVDIKTESHVDESNVHVIRLMEKIPLPNNTIVEFELGMKKPSGGYTEKVVVQHNRQLDSIRIHTDSSILKKMAISPIASNTFDIVFHNHKQFDKVDDDE